MASTATSLYSVPAAYAAQHHHSLLSNQSRFLCRTKWSPTPPTTPVVTNNPRKNPSRLMNPYCSPSSTPLVDKQEEQSSTQDDSSAESQPSTVGNGSFSPRGCEACGREEMEKNCDGDGRIQGGIATVPGFGWWPIKAYRPCPGFLASGGRYRRRGQTMDEVTSGGGRREPSVRIGNEMKTKKKK